MSNLEQGEILISQEGKEPEEKLNISNSDDNGALPIGAEEIIPPSTENCECEELKEEPSREDSLTEQSSEESLGNDETVSEQSAEEIVTEVFVEEISADSDNRKARRLRRSEGGGDLKDKKSSGWVSTLILAIICLFVAFVNFSWFYCVKVDGDSMNSTLSTGDYLAVDKLATPERGDVIVFTGSFAGASEKSYIKRIVAVEGDTVRIADGKLFLQKSGETAFILIDESYYPTVIGQTFSLNAGESYQKLIPEGHVFVLGDNRENSRDSRLFGFIPVECIDGVVHQTMIDGKDGFLGKICEYVFRMREYVYVNILKRAESL